VFLYLCNTKTKETAIKTTMENKNKDQERKKKKKKGIFVSNLLNTNYIYH
jgi:hypothetical protein